VAAAADVHRLAAGRALASPANQFKTPSVMLCTRVSEPRPNTSPLNVGFDHYGTRYEWRRLQTFTDWPLDAPRPAELAKAGFYFTPAKDAADRFVSKGSSSGWLSRPSFRVQGLGSVVRAG
jgi:hypothetical protein